jgi:hypothetical protein
MQQFPPADRLEPAAPSALAEKPDLTAANQASIDTEHASTGWSAYDVWRTRIRALRPDGHDEGPKKA